MPERRAQACHVHRGESGHFHDGVRHSGVHEVIGPGPPLRQQLAVEPPVARRRHPQEHAAIEDFGTDFAGDGLDAHLGGRDAAVVREARDAARAVAAHLRLAAVGIEKPHAKIRRRRGLHQHDAIGADPGAPRHDLRQPGAVVRRKHLLPVVHQQEVVGRAMHFAKRYFHIITPVRRHSTTDSDVW